MDKVRRGISRIAPGYADGGVVSSPFTIRGVINGAKKLLQPSPPEDIIQKFARQDAERAAKTPVQAAPVAEKQNVIDVINNRNKMLQGLKDGGPVKAGIIRGPGTGTSDSIKGTMTPGSFVMPKDSTDVMVSNGETHFTPDMVQKVGAMALMAMKDATHTPVAEQKPDNYFDDGGIVGEKKKNSFGSTAAQIPTSGNAPAPAYDGSSSTELGRNVSNTISALPGAAPVLSGANALFSASRAGQAATSGAASAANVAQKVMPSATPAAGLYGISRASGTERVDPQTQSVPPATAAPMPTQMASPAAATQPAVAANPSTPVPTAPAPALATPTTGQVTRVGNSYSGDNVSGNASFVDGQGKSLGPSSGGISPQNQQAAQALSDNYTASSRMAAPAIEKGGVNHGDGSGNVGLGYAANLARKNAETGASSIFNTASRQTARDSLKAMDAQELAGTNNQSSQQIAKLSADTQRVGYGIQAQNNQATQQNAAARLGIDRTTAGLNNQATQQKISSGQQMQDLQTKLLTAKPEERAGLEANLRALQGDYAKPVQDKYTAFTDTGTDGTKTNHIFNERNGQIVQQQGQKQPAAPPQAGAVVDGYKFKGGNPSDKNNWEKK